ncbi:MAG: leucine-rich repeat protein [Lachnospiraceae bacterium]|nr:leucine-rich repeat protein [Lachnospiraceae bacterium]
MKMTKDKIRTKKWTGNILRTLCAGAILMLSLFVCPTKAKAASDPVWSLDNTTGTLTITGTGEVVDKDDLTAEQELYDVKKIVFSEGITTIGDTAFCRYDNLETVVLPSTLTEIKRYGFVYCEKLTNVEIPSNVKRIGTYAFYGSSIPEVTLPSGLTYLGADAFSESTVVKNRPEKLTLMDDGSYQYVMNLAVTAEESYTKAYEVLDLVNKERAAAGRAALVMDKDLLETAMLRAAECSLTFTHNRPTGDSCFSACEKMFGENIAYGAGSASGVMNMWMNSSGHRSNILGSSYVSIGIGCVSTDAGIYWVQCFGIEDINPVTKSSCKDRTITQNIKGSLDSGLLTVGLTAKKKSITVGDTTSVVYDCGYTTILPQSLVYESSDPSVCTINTSGTVTALKEGTSTIKVYPTNYPEGAKTVKITVKAVSSASSKSIAKAKVTYTKSVAYNGKNRSSLKKVVLGSKTLKKNTDYTVSYSNNKNPGKASFTITGKGKYKGTIKRTFTIVPATRQWKQVRSTKAKTLTLSWNGTNVDTTTYQIQIASKSTMKKTKTYKIAGDQNTYTVEKLKSKKTYYVRIRSYKRVSGKNYYGKWSKVKKVKIK